MKALVFEGRDLHLQDVPIPTPGRHEALIRVLYAGICNTDIEILKGYMNFQGIIGHEFVGVVEKCPYPDLVGKTVVGEINISCGKCEFCLKGMKNHCPNRSVLGIKDKNGAMAEYVTLPIANLHVLPPKISHLEGVFVEPLAAACEILEQIDIQPEYRVLLVGDGKLAQLIAQVLRHHTQNLTVVGKHRNKLKLMEEHGIRTVLLENLDFPPKYFHMVVEATGNPSGLDIALQYIRPRGFLVLKSTYYGEHPFNPAQIVIDELNVIGSRCGPFPRAISLLEHREVMVESLISGIFPLEQWKLAFQKAQAPNALKIILQISE